MQNFIPGRYDVSIEIDGKQYSGYYTETKSMITVYYNCHHKGTQKSFNGDISMARTLLWELVREYGDD